MLREREDRHAPAEGQHLARLVGIAHSATQEAFCYKSQKKHASQDPNYHRILTW